MGLAWVTTPYILRCPRKYGQLLVSRRHGSLDWSFPSFTASNPTFPGTSEWKFHDCPGEGLPMLEKNDVRRKNARTDAPIMERPSSKESTREPTKESTKESTKEPAREVAKEPSREASKSAKGSPKARR